MYAGPKIVYVHVMPMSMSMSMLLVHVYAACPVYGACLCPCFIPMSKLHTPTSNLHDHVYAAWHEYVAWT
jgi:hypothetical protein